MAQLISGTLLAAQHQERLWFMDCFGKAQFVYLSLTGGPSRAEKITSTLAGMQASEDAVKTYAAANGMDLTQSLAEGAAAVAAALQGASR